MREELRTRGRAVPARWPASLLARLIAGLRGLSERDVAVTNILMIALGASIGANLRYALSNWAAQQWGTTFPYGTMIINVLGSCCIGLILGLAANRIALSVPWRLLLVTGLLGGFTTFSTFSYETYGLLVEGSWLSAGLNILGSVGVGLIGVFLGVGLARLIP
jgi:fluoride exporter